MYEHEYMCQIKTGPSLMHLTLFLCLHVYYSFSCHPSSSLFPMYPHIMAPSHL